MNSCSPDKLWWDLEIHTIYGIYWSLGIVILLHNAEAFGLHNIMKTVKTKEKRGFIKNLCKPHEKQPKHNILYMGEKNNQRYCVLLLTFRQHNDRMSLSRFPVRMCRGQ